MKSARSASSLRNERAYSVVLHAKPADDVVDKLKGEQPVVKLLQVELVVVELDVGRQCRSRNAVLDFLADLDEAVGLLVVALDELGEEAEARRGIGGEGSEERGDDGEDVLRVLARRRFGSAGLVRALGRAKIQHSNRRGRIR